MISIDAGLLAALAGLALIGFVMWCAFAMVRDDGPRRDGMWVLPYDPDAAYDPLEAVGGVPAQESLAVRLELEREAWSQRFGGGVIPFDNAYFRALERGAVGATATAEGCNALLDAYTAHLIAVLG